MFTDLADAYCVPLEPDERATMRTLSTLRLAALDNVMVAIDTKAYMTTRGGSLRRLCDELDSTRIGVRQAAPGALVIAPVLVNAASGFVSSVRNDRWDSGAEPEMSVHRQPGDTRRVLDRLSGIGRRPTASGVGFDGIGVTILDLANDGTPVHLLDDSPAPQPGESLNYDEMVTRMASEYDARFGLW